MPLENANPPTQLSVLLKSIWSLLPSQPRFSLLALLLIHHWIGRASVPTKLVAKALVQVPAAIRPLFDDPPLLVSENRQAYFSLLGAIADDIKPTGVIEWLWVKDIVLQTWEIQRLWDFRQRFIELRRIARAGSMATDAYVQELKAGNPNMGAIDELIARERIAPETKRRLTPKLVTEADSAIAFGACIEIIERLDRQIVSLERRRNNTLREIELHREIQARRRPREASTKTIEVTDSKALGAAA
jgi:hypothetical protein